MIVLFYLHKEVLYTGIKLFLNDKSPNILQLLNNVCAFIVIKEI